MTETLTVKPDKIIRSKRSSIALEITPDARLIVRVPRHVKPSEIEKVLTQKSSWIREKQNALLERGGDIIAPRYLEGERHLFLGEKFDLHLIDEDRDLYFDQAFYLSKTRHSDARNEFVHWYREKAQETFAARTAFYAKENRFKYRLIELSNAKRRWGSCSSSGYVKINWRLIMAPQEVIDYVIVHELCHLRYQNHGSRFWKEVESILPDFRKASAWLKDHQYIMAF